MSRTKIGTGDSQNEYFLHTIRDRGFAHVSTILVSNPVFKEQTHRGVERKLQTINSGRVIRENKLAFVYLCRD